MPELGIGRRGALAGHREIVALDAHSVPSFERLQQRWPQSRRPSTALLRAVPARFYAFDVLSRGGQDVTARPTPSSDQAVDGICAFLDGYEVANAIHVWRDDGPTTNEVLMKLVGAIVGYIGDIHDGR